MTQNERNYYEQLMNLTPEDIKSGIIEAMRLPKDKESKYEVLNNLYNIEKSINDDILDSRKNIIVSYSVIEQIKNNITNLIIEQENQTDNKEKSKYDEVISNGINSLDAMFNQIQNIVQDIDICNDAKDYIEILKNIVQNEE